MVNLVVVLSAVLASGAPSPAAVTSRPAATQPTRTAAEIAALAAQLRDADVTARLAAVDALGREDTPPARTALVEARRDVDRRVALAAWRALLTLRAPEARPIVMDALYDGDDQVRLLALPWVAELKSRGAPPALIGLLRDETSSEALRLAAARALAVLGEDSGIPELANTLNTRDLPATVTDAVRIEAARSLGVLGTRFALDALLKAATQHPSAPVRAAAVVALAPYASTARLGARIIAAAQAADAPTRLKFLAAARESGKAADAVFTALAADPDPAVRAAAGKPRY